MAVQLFAQQEPNLVFRTSTNLVVVTVFVRDKNGLPIQDLKKEDFVLMEGGKPQTISVFEFQSLKDAPLEAPMPGLIQRGEERARPATAPQPAASEGSQRFRDKRLLVLFFDWSSLPETDQIRAIEAGERFVREQMTTADLVSIRSFGTQLKVDVDFTSDRDALLQALRAYMPGQMSELSAAANTEADSAEDSAFAADDTEFNVFNTDRKLGALEDMARSLQGIAGKKAVIYFASGVSRTGMDNESQLRATINSAVRSNVSFYPVDSRGLVASPAGGDARSAGGRGSGLFTGRTQAANIRSLSDSQETLYSLAADTGGKALLDENELSLGIRQAQQDIQSYYVLGYYSSDERRDGRFRKVEVKLAKQLAAKLDYRAGYFAEKDFQAFSSYDRERQLQDALTLGDPITDLPMAVEVNYFRLSKDQYFVPIAVKIPGSEVPVAKKGSAETTRFDFIGEVRGPKNAIAANVRDEIKIQLRDQQTGKLASRSLVYDTGFVLAPGAYRLKMLARENLSGKMGTFEARFEIPDLSGVKDAVRMSSVVLSSQRQPVTGAVGVASKKDKKQEAHPLVRLGQKLIPSVTRVFRTDQSLYVYAEVYDPPVGVDTERPAVAATLSLFRDRQKAFESRPVRTDQFLPTRNKAAGLLIEVPLRSLAPGEYTAQLNVIDQTGQRFAYDRERIVILR